MTPSGRGYIFSDWGPTRRALALCGSASVWYSSYYVLASLQELCRPAEPCLNCREGRFFSRLIPTKVHVEGTVLPLHWGLKASISEAIEVKTLCNTFLQEVTIVYAVCFRSTEGRCFFPFRYRSDFIVELLNDAERCFGGDFGFYCFNDCLNFLHRHILTLAVG